MYGPAARSGLSLRRELIGADSASLSGWLEGSSRKSSAVMRQAFASIRLGYTKFCLTIDVSRTNVQQMEERELRVGAAGAGFVGATNARSMRLAGATPQSAATDRSVDVPVREPMEVAP